MFNWPGERADSSFEEDAWAQHQSPAPDAVPEGHEEPHARMGLPVHGLEETKEGVSNIRRTELGKGEHLPSLAPLNTSSTA